MDVAIMVGIVSAAVAALALYFQFLRSGSIRCVRPSTCMIRPIHKDQAGIVVPLSIRNTGARLIGVNRFSLHLTPRLDDENLSPNSQVGLRWFLAGELSDDAQIHYGTPFTVSSSGTTDLVVGFLTDSAWPFTAGHSQILVLAHTEHNQDGIALCRFDIHLSERDLERIKNREKISLFQRWYDKKDSWNIMIPHERDRDLAEEAAIGCTRRRTRRA